METQILTRRQLLVAIGAAIAGTTVLGSGGIPVDTSQPAAPGTPVAGIQGRSLGLIATTDVLLGVLERLAPPAQFFVRRGATTIAVTLRADARLWHGALGPTADLAAFIMLDRVAVTGTWRGESFLANSVCSLCQVIEGRLLQRQQGQLRIPDGVIEISQATRPIDPAKFPASRRVAARSFDRLRVGDDLIAEVWRHPTTKTFFAHALGVKQTTS